MARILIIDDDSTSRDVLRQFVETKGHTVIEAKDANEGLEIFLKEKVDLVISDFIMPGKSGIDLLREMRGINPKVLFVMVTGYPSLETATLAIKDGAYDYMTKPVERDQLAAVMNRALATLELRSNLTAVRGMNVALLVSIPVWILLGFLVRMLLR
jgi:DNA-binding NtrC family response regulator